MVMITHLLYLNFFQSESTLSPSCHSQQSCQDGVTPGSEGRAVPSIISLELLQSRLTWVSGTLVGVWARDTKDWSTSCRLKPQCDNVFRKGAHDTMPSSI